MTITDTTAPRTPTGRSKRGSVLLALRRAAPGGCRIVDIARALECAPITVRRHVQALREQGLVYRLVEPGPRPTREDGTRRAGRGYYEYRAARPPT